MDENQGYIIRRSVLFDNGRGFALGESPKSPAPFVTWQFTQEDGKRDYYWGRYHGDGATAERDFNARATTYRHDHGVKEVERQSTQESYTYYSQRPIDLKEYPKSYFNELLDMTHYIRPTPVEGGVIQAWGSMTYAHPLTQQEIREYGLCPSPRNLDMRRLTEKKPTIAEQLKAAEKLAQENRGTPAPKKDAPNHGDR